MNVSCSLCIHGLCMLQCALCRLCISHTMALRCLKSMCTKVPWYNWYILWLRANGCDGQEKWPTLLVPSWAERGCLHVTTWHHPIKWREEVVFCCAKQGEWRWPSRQCIWQRTWRGERYPDDSTVCCVVITAFHIWAGIWWWATVHNRLRIAIISRVVEFNRMELQRVYATNWCNAWRMRKQFCVIFYSMYVTCIKPGTVYYI